MKPKILVSIYVCDECRELFMVEHQVEPTKCAVCGSEAWKWSHDGSVVETDEQANRIEDNIEDKINHLYHYTAGGIETIDYLKAKMTEEQFEGYLFGNTVKYLSRYRLKNGLEDLRKAQWYLNRLIAEMENKRSEGVEVLR